MDLMSIGNAAIINGGDNLKNSVNRINSEETTKEDIVEVAKEMESLFALQLIKVMRDTSKSISTETKGLGNDTYMGMFDIEVSKLFAERGLGLRDMLVEQLERTVNTKDDVK